MANYINHINIGNSDYLIKDTTHPEIKFYYPTGTAAVTTSPYYCARYDVTDAEVTAYADGMMVWFEVPVAGNDTYGTGLQINSLGYKPIVCDTNTPIGNRYSVGSRIWCIYNSTQTATLYINNATATTVTGCWQVMDYNSESVQDVKVDGNSVVDSNKIAQLITGTSSSTLAAGDHIHGNITNGGDITTNVAIASGDRLVINDESASKINNSSITFGTNVTQYLTNSGIWKRPITNELVRPTGLRGVNDPTLQGLFDVTRANRLMFLPADQIIVEKTTDGGATWVDAGIPDNGKLGLFNEKNAAVTIPLLNGIKSLQCGIRITITAMKYNVPEGTTETNKYNYWNSTYVKSTERYCQIKDWYFWLSANTDTIGLKIERAGGSTSTTWQTIFNDTNFYMVGWSGNNYVSTAQGTFGGSSTQVNNYWNYRLTFMTRGVNGTSNMATTSTTAAQVIQQIRAYGDIVWTAPNNMMSIDHLYSWDANQNATFPAGVTAAYFNGQPASTANVASGDTVLIADSSNSNKIAKSNITFGASTTQFLANNGTWQTPAGGTSVIIREWSDS